MSLRENIPAILKFIDENRKLLEHNEKLFDIFEGDLLTSIEEELRKQLNPKSFEASKGRIAPINVLRRIIQKLSKIYAEAPIRRADNDTDQELMGIYEKEMGLNTHLNDGNEFFNLFKTAAIEPFVEDGKPRVRVIPSSQFLVWSDDPVNPLRMTLFIKFMGKMKKKVIREVKEVSVFFLYTDFEFLAIDSEGDVVEQFMRENPEGINPFGKIPFIYINRSRHRLTPLPDSDILKLTLLIPILLSDLNYAVLFGSHSVFYGIDLDFENLEYSPNSFWSFSSDPEGNGKPEIGTVEPRVEIDKVIDLIKTTLAFWLESRNLRPGAVGNLTSDNVASGISLIVQNMDTTEDKKQQITFFQEAEKNLWDLISKNLHPVWVSQGMIEERRLFSLDFSPSIQFSEQKPLVTETEKRQNLKLELDLGLTTKRQAIKTLHPEMSDEEIESLIQEIDDEGSIQIEQ